MRCCVPFKSFANRVFGIVHQVIFLGIDNIHGMRDSLTKMREFLDTHGASSSDGSSSLLVCKCSYFSRAKYKRLTSIRSSKGNCLAWNLVYYSFELYGLLSCSCSWTYTGRVLVQRSGGRAWVGGNVASIAGAASALGDSGWLLHCHKILTSAVWIAARIHLEGASVLVHCR